VERITEVTKNDILDLFRYGVEIDVLFSTERVKCLYYGRIDEFEFLKRLYNLDNMPSNDSRYQNAAGDIWQHMVKNDDYLDLWVFEDERFQLKNGSDEIYLRFICEIFHPAVRNEKGYWKEFLIKINELLQNDGYELYPSKKISNRDIYDWRIFQPDEIKMFIPYSQRNSKAIKDKAIVLSIKKRARDQIYQLLDRYDYYIQEISDTGYRYEVSVSDKVFSDIRMFYPPKCYNDQKQYVETNNLQDFISSCSPFCVLDAIEFFGKYNQSNGFQIELNSILKLNEIALKLDGGKVINLIDGQIKSSTLIPIQEAGLKELLQEAAKYYDEGNFKIATEKLWDAFERLKTYYSPALDKKKSVKRIVDEMGANKDAYSELFEREFNELTAIGNNFRIRHHETTKIDIEEDRHYDYFYKRCLSLISVAIQYLL